MGIAVVLALVLFVFNLIRTMRSAGEPGPKKSPPSAVRFASTLPVRS
jgi:hypothetical protein